MRLTPMMVAATLAATMGTAMAQVGPAGPPASATQRSPGMTQAPQHVPAVDPLKAQDVSHFDGAAVYGSDGSKIGSISTELMDPATHQINKLVVNVGAVLGMGGHKVAMPLDQFKWDTQKEGLTVEKTAADMKGMPAWAEASATEGSGSSTAPTH
ncbi:MAG TPA: PRC-barrel domain-containing protein [Stellaceae bacterium]|nr:PRC-barrel domain-containing protein [Stellaceae bacterium]